MNDLIMVLKALADETRFEIISILLIHDFCVGALAKRLNISEAAVSQHLQILRKSGLVRGEKRGYYTHYCVEKDTLKNVSIALLELAANKVSYEGSCRQGKSGKHQCCGNGNIDK